MLPFVICSVNKPYYYTIYPRARAYTRTDKVTNDVSSTYVYVIIYQRIVFVIFPNSVVSGRALSRPCGCCTTREHRNQNRVVYRGASLRVHDEDDDDIRQLSRPITTDFVTRDFLGRKRVRSYFTDAVKYVVFDA